MPQTASLARPAGALYLAIIVIGLTVEMAIRLPLIADDAATTASNILAHGALFRLSLIGDMAMVAADIALALLLYTILRPISPLLAALAAAFRLMQGAVIAGNLMNQQAAWMWLTAALPGIPPDMAAALAYQALDVHAHGYDLGLMFFAVNSVLTGLLLIRSPDFATVFGALLIAAGAVYLTGSTLRFLAPDWAAPFAPAYLLAVIAETALALRLLTMGLRRPAGWRQRAI